MMAHREFVGDAPISSGSPSARDSELRALMARLKETRVRLAAYDGPLLEAAFDLMNANTLLAGIVYGALRGRTAAHLATSQIHEQPLWGTEWRMSDGSVIDLASEPELLRAARMLEGARWTCRLHVLFRAPSRFN